MNPYASPETQSPALPAVDRRFRIYWTNRSIPELADLPREERGRLWRRHCWGAFGHWQTLLAMLGMAVWCMLPALPMPLGWIISIEADEVDMAVWFFLLLALSNTLGGFVFSQVFIAMARPYLRAAREEQMGAESAGGDGDVRQSPKFL